jgi:circadian clock protein KaiC
MEPDLAEQTNTRGQIIHDSTGVPHLDLVLGGGIPRGGLVLIMGVPGSGKTTLASQIAFAAAKAGKRVLVLTTLSEPTNKLLTHLSAFTFFDRNLIGGPVQVLSLQQVLPGGLKATSEEVRVMARQHQAGLVLLDGFRGMLSIEQDSQGARELLYTLGTTLSARGATLLVTSETDPRDPAFFPETTTADVILGLHYRLEGVRQLRGLEVIKARGGAPLPGLHAMTLGSEGASIYPQLEERVAASLLGNNARTQGAVGGAAGRAESSQRVRRMAERASFGLPELDALLSGGLNRTSSTLLTGSLGTGKTLTALHFIVAGVRAGESAVLLSLREREEQLRLFTEPFAIGAEFSASVESGAVTLLEALPIKVNPDVIADHLLNVLDATKATRLVIDSVAELERALVRSGDSSRLEEYLAALVRALQSRGVTGLFIKETPKVLGPILDFSTDPLSVLAENLLLLQQMPFRGQVHRVLTVLKMRYSAHDTSLRQFRIRPPQGLEVLTPLESGSDLLAGLTAWQGVQEQAVSAQRRARSSGKRLSEREDMREKS